MASGSHRGEGRCAEVGGAHDAARVMQGVELAVELGLSFVEDLLAQATPAGRKQPDEPSQGRFHVLLRGSISGLGEFETVPAPA